MWGCCGVRDQGPHGRSSLKFQTHATPNAGDERTSTDRERDVRFGMARTGMVCTISGEFGCFAHHESASPLRGRVFFTLWQLPN